jgi:hypothetical protein
MVWGKRLGVWLFIALLLAMGAGCCQIEREIERQERETLRAWWEIERMKY